MSQKEPAMDRDALNKEPAPSPELEQPVPFVLQEELLANEDQLADLELVAEEELRDPSDFSGWGFDTPDVPSALLESGVVPAGSVIAEGDDASALETLEIQLLLEGIYKRYGFDFRQYSPGSFKRRIWKCLRSENLTTISGLQDKIFHDPVAWKRFLATVTVNVTSMFRDPEFYRAVRTLVVPLLAESPFIRIWHAGCASGEEVYSTAILLQESGLLDRCRIYATDVNEAVLARARNGIYRLEETAKYNENYVLAGGTATFSNYYQERYGHCIMDSSLRDKILFAKHDLVTDGSFNDFNLILCRNVLIYFSQGLQEHVHQLLYKSLAHEGILGLGQKETLRHTNVEECYRSIAEGERLYQKIA